MNKGDASIPDRCVYCHCYRVLLDVEDFQFVTLVKFHRNSDFNLYYNLQRILKLLFCVIKVKII